MLTALSLISCYFQEVHQCYIISIPSLSPISSIQKAICRKGALRNFDKVTGKHLWQSLFLTKVAGLSPDYKFCEISENTFSYRTTPVAASVDPMILCTSLFHSYKIMTNLFSKISSNLNKLANVFIPNHF